MVSKRMAATRRRVAKRRATRKHTAARYTRRATTRRATKRRAPHIHAARKRVVDVVQRMPIKKPFIKPQAPAVIAKEVTGISGKLKHIPVLVIGAIIGAYVLLKRK